MLFHLVSSLLISMWLTKAGAAGLNSELLALVFSSQQKAEPSVECVEDLDDFSNNAWSSSPHWEYSLTSDDLPGILRNKFDGKGIWWMEGGQNLIIVKNFIGALFTRPMFLYIKYYNHIQINVTEKSSFGHPALYPDLEGHLAAILKFTSDFVWGEQVIELDVNKLEEGHLVGISEINFDVGEYFIVDRIIISQGYDLGNQAQLDDIKSLCGWDDQIGTTTEMVETTTRVPLPGICQGEGYFPDPDDCSKFHVCRLDEHSGEFIDEVFTCPAMTNWCQRTLMCETPEICPCAL